MEKYYLLQDCSVRVVFKVGLIGITNDNALKRLMHVDLNGVTDELIRLIKADYALFQGTPLAISDDSLVVEIWGHVYAEYLLLKYRKVMRAILIFGIYARLRKSCEVIDCGEREKDPNRRLWDRLTRYRGWFGKRLAKADLLRFAE